MYERQYFIDWLRVIAIGILLIFHIAIMYQSYAKDIRFIQSPILLDSLLIPLSFSSVFRIPLLFFISGMGVYFSLQRRNWLQMLLERTKRILIPLVFGSLLIVPVHKYIYVKYYNMEYSYSYDFGHLWFLFNIILCVLWFLAVFYFAKEIENSRFVEFLKRMVNKNPILIYVICIPYNLQALTIPSEMYYSIYYDPKIGYALGAVAFVIGYFFVNIGEPIWKALSKIKYFTLLIGVLLFSIRAAFFDHHGFHIVTSFESISLILSVFGFGYTYLNKQGKLLSYLNPSAYPIYIVHMVFLYLGAYFIFPMNLSPWLSLIGIIVFTFSGCFLTYEVIKRVFFLRPLFGMKIIKSK